MPAATATIIGVAGLALGAAGAYTSYKGQEAQAKASRRSEMLRKQQMHLEASRKRREAIRKMIIQQGLISNNTANAGAGQGSSGNLGGIAAVGTNTAFNASNTSMSENIGGGIFDANADYASAGATVALGTGMGNLGGQLVQNSAAGGRVVESLFGGSGGGQDFSRLY